MTSGPLWAAESCRYEQRQFRYLFERVDRPVPAGAEIVTAYTDGTVTLRRNRRVEGYHEAASLDGFKGVARGDFVVHGLDILRGSIGVSDSEGAISAVCVTSRPRPGLEPRFFAYALRAQAWSGYTRAFARGVREGGADFRRWSTLGDLRLPAPSTEIQRAVADFLDAETTRIDALVIRKRRLLSLISLRRRAAIGEAINSTGGEELPLRRVIEAFIDYRGATPEKVAAGVPLVTATNVADGEIDFSLGEQFVSEETYAEWMRRGLPEAGDVLLTTEAPLGEVAMIDEPRIALAQRIILLKPDRRRVEPEFLYASLRSPQVQADLLSRASGSTVWGIRADRLRDVRLHVPHLIDQRRIVTTSQRLQQEYQRARGLLRVQVDLLRERRQALITAAVTGQIDVAKAAG